MSESANREKLVELLVEGGEVRLSIPYISQAAAEAIADFLIEHNMIAQEEPTNDPLTLEELQQMDGEPVWVTINREKYKYPSDCEGYCVIDGDDALVPGAENYWWDFETYGEKWIAYRRKPEKEK